MPVLPIHLTVRRRPERRVALVVDVIGVRASTGRSEQEVALLTLQALPEELVVRFLTDLADRRAEALGFRDGPAQVSRGCLDHPQVGPKNEAVRPGDREHVRESRHRNALVGLVSVLIPKLPEVDTDATD